MRTKSQIGKASKAAGARFELKVRKDLESKGWIVSKWMNNVDLKFKTDTIYVEMDFNPTTKQIGRALQSTNGRLTPAKHKFRGPGIPMAIGTGFPDFIAYEYKYDDDAGFKIHTINGVEVKSNGYLDKIEKEKCKWLLDNSIFSKILIAKKGKKRGEIIYDEFNTK